MTFVDTNVLLDLVTDDPRWADWSIAQLEATSLNGPLLINDVVYAELSIRYDRIEDLESVPWMGPKSKSHQSPGPHCFLRGRSCPNIGVRVEHAPVCCRLFISAHAAINHLPLLTRDVGRYQYLFPSLTLIAPGD